MLHDFSALSNFEIKGCVSKTAEGSNEEYKSSFPNLGEFVQDGLGIKLKEGIVHVCYFGVFLVHNVNPDVLQEAEKLLSQGDNIKEGHFMERLLGPFLHLL